MAQGVVPDKTLAVLLREVQGTDEEEDAEHAKDEQVEQAVVAEEENHLVLPLAMLDKSQAPYPQDTVHADGAEQEREGCPDEGECDAPLRLDVVVHEAEDLQAAKEQHQHRQDDGARPEADDAAAISGFGSHGFLRSSLEQVAYLPVLRKAPWFGRQLV